MLYKSVLGLASVVLVAAGNPALSQVYSVYECEVESEAAFVDNLDRFYEAMAGGFRPTVTLDDIVWNGSNENTHRLIFGYQDYQEYETFQARIADTAASQLIIEESSDIAECSNERLSIERGFWGEQGPHLTFIALFPIMTTDPASYAEAFEDLAASELGAAAPGGMGLFESRAGGDGADYFVSYTAPGMGSLNEWLDMFAESDDFQSFVEEVAEFRTVGPGVQMRRVESWQP